MNLHENTVGIEPKNDSDYDFRHQSMTLDFDPFWMFKMIGDPLFRIGDPKKLSPKKNMGDITSKIALDQNWCYVTL